MVEWLDREASSCDEDDQRHSDLLNVELILLVIRCNICRLCPPEPFVVPFNIDPDD